MYSNRCGGHNFRVQKKNKGRTKTVCCILPETKDYTFIPTIVQLITITSLQLKKRHSLYFNHNYCSNNTEKSMGYKVLHITTPPIKKIEEQKSYNIKV